MLNHSKQRYKLFYEILFLRKAKSKITLFLRDYSFKYKGYRACNTFFIPEWNYPLIDKISQAKSEKKSIERVGYFTYSILILLILKLLTITTYRGYTTILAYKNYTYFTFLKNSVENDVLNYKRFKPFCKVLV